MEDNGFRREFDAVLAGVCRRIGVPPSGAQLLHLHGNAVFGFPAAGLVIRISGSQAALARITESLKVTAWLAEARVPVHGARARSGAALRDRRQGRLGLAVRARGSRPSRASAADLARLLRDLHSRPLPPSPAGGVHRPARRRHGRPGVSARGCHGPRATRLAGQARYGNCAAGGTSCASPTPPA